MESLGKNPTANMQNDAFCQLKIDTKGVHTDTFNC